ncbi:MAG: hypothetical protein COB66_01270 [Coxiella sp. (in: Bacteria)]|nr:MAG: hypothetical protein COB66_01270 [Coxiella sp. (in: g-proteobacteria)]
MFRQAPAAPAPAPTQAAALAPVGPAGTSIQEPNIQPQTGPGTDVNGVVPQQLPGAPEGPKPPLEEFKDLWQTAPVDPKAPADPNAPQTLNLADVQKVVGNQNMTAAVTPEMLAAVTGGGEGAAEALNTLLTTVAQNTLTQSMMINQNLTAKAVERALAGQDANLNARIKSEMGQAHLLDTNPLFNDPAVQPVIAAVQERLQVQFPNATPAERTKMTQDFIITMGDAFKPAPEVVTKPGETDWSAYITK